MNRLCIWSIPKMVGKYSQTWPKLKKLSSPRTKILEHLYTIWCLTVKYDFINNFLNLQRTHKCNLTHTEYWKLAILLDRNSKNFSLPPDVEFLNEIWSTTFSIWSLQNAPTTHTHTHTVNGLIISLFFFFCHFYAVSYILYWFNEQTCSLYVL